MADGAKNGKTGCLVAVILGVIGIGASIWGGVNLFGTSIGMISGMFSHEYVVPGRHVINLPKPGEYMIWHEHFAKIGDKTYESSPGLDLNVSIKQRDTGREVAIHDPGSTQQTIQMPEHKAVLFGTFSISEGGEYLLEVTAERQGGETVLAIGPAPDKAAVTSILSGCGVFGLAGLALLGALIFGIIAIVRMSTYKRQEQASPYQIPPPPMPPQA